MLPYGLLTVIWLASAAAARPQQPALANATQTSAPPTTISLPPGDIQGPSSSTGGFEPCTDELQTCPFIIPELTTATGFEDPDEIKHTKPPVILPTSKPPAVTVKTTPTVLSVQTNYAPTAIPGGPGNYDTPSPPGQTVGPGHGNTPNSPNLQQPSNNDLLDDIISRVTNPQQPTGPEPVEPAPQVTGPGGTIINGLPITIGPASLILTPGLSTTVGTDTDAIFIGMRTDGTGQTIIVLSSSGTAVTATITNAPRTVTLPKSGFEASLTQAARPGDIVRTSSGGAAAATSSKGVAPGRDEMGWWSGLALGILGFGIVL